LRWPAADKAGCPSGLQAQVPLARHQRRGARENDDIGNFAHLGPLGTALLPYRLPRVLLIDELAKSDVEPPNDLVTAFRTDESPGNQLLRFGDREPVVTVHTVDLGITAVMYSGIVRLVPYRR
jgi:hypothetical protein